MSYKEQWQELYEELEETLEREPTLEEINSMEQDWMGDRIDAAMDLREEVQCRGDG